MRLAINGFGRIGRCLLRALLERRKAGRTNQTLVAINELANIETMAYLARYDSTHGRLSEPLFVSDSHLRVADTHVAVSHEPDAARLPWRDLAIDLVMECTGTLASKREALAHLDAGAGRVLFSQPASQDVDATVVAGVNDHTLNADARVVSAASCTTNCITPVIAALDSALGVEYGVITTIHSVMNDQPVLDAYHHTDLRKTRAAGRSIIPVDTQLAVGIDRILPHLSGRFEAQAMRVPTLDVSAMDLSLTVKRAVSRDDVNRILAQAARERPDVLGYSEEPLASCDFIHDPRSSIVDASQTRVSGNQLVKVLAWFDNEWGFANRMLDLAELWEQRLHLGDSNGS